MIFILLRLVVAAFVLAGSGDSRPGDFKIIGPGGGGAMFHPTISPHDPNTVLISCDMTGSYITHDAGKSWRMVAQPGRGRDLAVDLSAPILGEEHQDEFGSLGRRSNRRAESSG